MWIRIDRMQIRIHKIWSMRIRIQVNRNFFSKQVLIFRSKKNLLIFKSESKPLRLARIRRMSAMMSSFSDLKIINSISCIIESALLLFLLLPKRKKMLVQLLFFSSFYTPGSGSGSTDQNECGPTGQIRIHITGLITCYFLHSYGKLRVVLTSIRKIVSVYSSVQSR